MAVSRVRVDFSGLARIARNAVEQVGPGPNWFPHSEDNVRVDSQGRLHLRITQNGGRWICAGVGADQTLGYGRYLFQIVSRLDRLASSAVLGLFTWDDDPACANREIDIEVARWGDPCGAGLHYTVQAGSRPGRYFRAPIQLEGAYTSHSIDWYPDRIAFASWHGHYEVPPDENHVIAHHVYTGSDVPDAGNAWPCMNLWLFRGVPPESGEEVEVIVSGFRFRGRTGV